MLSPFDARGARVPPPARGKRSPGGGSEGDDGSGGQAVAFPRRRDELAQDASELDPGGGGSAATIRPSSRCRHPDTAPTRLCPLDVSSSVTTLRCRGSLPRSTCPAATSRSARRVTVDASRPRARATRADRARPSSARMASIRNWGRVITPSSTPRLRSATPARTRVAACSASTCSANSPEEAAGSPAGESATSEAAGAEGVSITEHCSKKHLPSESVCAAVSYLVRPS